MAENVRFNSGDLTPIKDATTEQLLTGDIGNLYYYEHFDSPGESEYIGFGENMEVYFARSPTPNDEHKRFYWNVRDDSLAEDQVGLYGISDPLDSSHSSVGTGAGYRHFDGWHVGIPAPNDAPEISDATELGEVAFGEVTSLSNTTPITVNLGSEPPFKNGDRVRIVIDADLPQDEDSNVGQVWSLEGQVGTVSNVTATSFDIQGVSGAGFETFEQEDVDAFGVKTELEDSDFEARAYVFTYVSKFGEEGPPSPSSNILDVPRKSAKIQISMTDVAHDFLNHGGSRVNVDKIRIYRTVSGRSGAIFLYVGELDFGGGSGSDGVSWDSTSGTNPEQSWNGTATESVAFVSLGEPLPSEKWYPPPNSLAGIHMMPNGFMIGWKGNTVYTSEPYLPHAWNPDNTFTVDDEIEGVQTFGSTLVIGTSGRPYIASGADPSSMVPRKVDFYAPLLQRRAMVDAGSGVFFPSTSGLVWVGNSGSENITENHYDQETWDAAIGGLERAVWFDGRAIFFARGENPLVVDVNGGEVNVSHITGLDIGAAAPAGKELVVLTPEAGDYRRVRKFRQDSDDMAGQWESGVLTLNRPGNLAVGQVYADGYPVTLILKHADLQSGQPDLDNMTEETYFVQGPEPFRLKSGYISREFVFELVFEHRVQQVLLATSMDDLKAAP